MPETRAPQNIRLHLLRLGATVSGAVVALTGLAVMLGWHFGIPQVTQPLPFTESMRYNTALLFFFSGIGLFLLAQSRHQHALIAALFTIVFGGATLMQYILGVNFGIDDLFYKHSIISVVEHPDRMAPNSALSFVIAGLAIALNVAPKKLPYSEMLAAVLSSLLLGLSSMALFGYLVQVETAYGWGKLTSMAIHTAAAFLLCAIGLLSYRYADNETRMPFTPRSWTAPVVGVLGITIAIAVWQTLDAREYSQIQRAHQLEFKAFRLHFESSLRADHDTLRRMGARMTRSEYYDPNAWIEDARHYVEDLTGYAAMAWLNENKQRVASTLARQDWQMTPPSDSLLDQARANEDIVIGTSMILSDGSKGFTEVLPLFHRSKFQGYLVVEKSYVDLLKPLLADMPMQGYEMQLFDRDALVYSQAGGDTLGAKHWRTDSVLFVAGRDWHLLATPSREHIQKQRSRIPYVILSGGIAIALLFATVIHLWQTKRGQSRRLVESEARLRSVADNMLDAMIIIDETSIIQSVNPATEQTFGYRREEMVGQSLEIFLPEEKRPEGLSFLRLAHRQAIDKTSEWEARRKDGTVFPFSLSLYEIASPPGTRHFACVCTDISQRRRTEELIRKLSLTDELTGLHNRRGFLTLAEQQLKLARRSRQPLHIGFVDIDGMKTINDRYGHAAGDLAIRTVAEALKQTFRDSDVLARIGGDEFVILAVDTDAPKMDWLLDNLLQSIEKSNFENRRPYHLSVSVGSVASDHRSDTTLESLLQQADQRMYRAKGNKRRVSQTDHTPSTSS